MTGDVYCALPMGSVPSALEKIIAEMAKKKLLRVRRVEDRKGYIPNELAFYRGTDFNEA